MSRGVPRDRLAIGQLLVRLLHEFRSYLMRQAEDSKYLDLRPAHLQIWGNMGIEGIRLTDLADKANLGLPACSELVDQLEGLGYVERRSDPSDGRAKLIFPTVRGRALLDAAGEAVADLEAAWGRAIGSRRFEETCTALNHLLALLGDSEAADLESWEKPAPEKQEPEVENHAEEMPAEAEPAATRIAVFAPGPRPGEIRTHQ